MAAATWRGTTLRVVVMALLFGAFFGFVARTAFDGVYLQRLVQFSIIAAAAILLAMACQRGIERWPRIASTPWARIVVTAVLMALPMGLLVWGLDVILVEPGPDLGDLPLYISISLVISGFMSTFAVFSLRDRVVIVPGPGEPAPRFVERLPPRLRGARIWAVEAEDHYLRLHTSKGQDLILMRLSDAIAELEGLEGAQAHRSWWVARDAIADVSRGDGRATLTLQDGSQVPVSRTYAKTLRERGWF